MPRTLTCRVGLLRAGQTLPTPLALGNAPLARHLERASAGGTGVGNLSLTFDLSKQSTSVLSDTTPTEAFWLQVALKRLTGNGTAGPVDRVGLIYADRWKRPGVLGMMFDLGFNPSDLQPVEVSFLTLPREGCAVFLDAIADFRNNPTDRHTEAMFTSVHELGHVFNLWHQQVPFRFMSSSTKDQVAGPPFAFDFVHQQYLTHVNDDHVWPGGKAFGDRGNLGPSDQQFKNALALPKSGTSLRLLVDITQRELWRFEPIELDIRVVVPRGVKKTYRLPDTVDPGYDSFDVWIEEPDGERRRYRSPRHYCQNVGLLKVSAAEPFARDLSLFGQSGGYTFRRSGRHSVWVTWRLPGDRIIESNHVEINIKSQLERSQEYISLHETLTNPRVASLLYHRTGRYRHEIVERIEGLADVTKNAPLEANLRYALGRFLERAGRRRSRHTRLGYHRRAQDQLHRALDLTDVLSTRRQYHAARICDEISQS